MKDIKQAFSPLKAGRMRIIAANDIGKYKMMMEGDVSEKACQAIMKICLKETIRQESKGGR